MGSYRFPILETSATALCGTTGIAQLWRTGFARSGNGITLAVRKVKETRAGLLPDEAELREGCGFIFSLACVHCFRLRVPILSCLEESAVFCVLWCVVFGICLVLRLGLCAFVWLFPFLLPSSSSRCQPSTASRHVQCSLPDLSRVQCSLPDLNRDHLSPVFPAGPQSPPSALSVPCRTSTGR